MLQAPEDEKMNYGMAVLKGLFEKWLAAKRPHDSIDQTGAGSQADTAQAAAQPPG